MPCWEEEAPQNLALLSIRSIRPNLLKFRMKKAKLHQISSKNIYMEVNFINNHYYELTLNLKTQETKNLPEELREHYLSVNK